MNSIFIFALISSVIGKGEEIEYCGKFYTEEEVSELVHLNMLS